MRQLVELTKHAETFSEMGVEIIVVFREEKEGVEGLKKIRERTKTPFTLCLDFGGEKTSRYSPGHKEFDSYVVDGNGMIAAKFDGTLRRRALSEQLFGVLKTLTAADSSEPHSATP